jgi:hypothetical protein
MTENEIGIILASLRLGARHYGIENKLINLAKSLSKKLKTGQEWNSDYKT